MTPVEATTTSDGSIPRAFPVRQHISSATASPPGLQVLALPLLQITARAYPSATFFFVMAMGAPFTRLVVYTHAHAARTWLTISARSFLSWFFRIPQCTPPAVKPFAAQTPPSICFITGSPQISPAVSSRPSMIFIFCTAAPDAPLPRLSNRAVTVVRLSFPHTIRRSTFVSAIVSE